MTDDPTGAKRDWGRYMRGEPVKDPDWRKAIREMQDDAAAAHRKFELAAAWEEQHRIVQIAVTENRLFALTRNGKLFARTAGGSWFEQTVPPTPEMPKALKDYIEGTFVEKESE